MQWNTSHSETYINSSLCGSVETGYDIVGSTGWGARGSDSSFQSEQEAGGVKDSRTRFLVGAWQGAPDGTGTDKLGGYFKGLIDNFEVRGLRIDTDKTPESD